MVVGKWIDDSHGDQCVNFYRRARHGLCHGWRLDLPAMGIWVYYCSFCSRLLVDPSLLREGNI